MWLDLFDCITRANEIFQESDWTLVSNEATSAQLNWGTGGIEASVNQISFITDPHACLESVLHPQKWSH